ncbi:HD domain-containing protein [Salisediminibacterium halotolerans]|uniref:HD domain-containing protein n=1 Tax=Salisediminibacterium halotolerans TaxID=517425 RepID=A0A1H9VDT5_9BACI|nr:HD domain-containing protein [Salisediminibacterium haloalkalitolerans]SES19936.1 uncharacterized protein SAMN05444126_12014 [Salisediminibacterium haloalkalitolerans]
MSRLTLLEIYEHPIAQKYVHRSGLAHAISTAYYAYQFALEYNVNPDLAVKAAFLHDMGHYTWYVNGEWDYDLYKENDIHPIKGAERAHKLLIRLGEDRVRAKEIALAVLFHTDSFLPESPITRTPLQEVVALADEADEEPDGKHHYRYISPERARKKIADLDRKIERTLNHFYDESAGAP